MLYIERLPKQFQIHCIRGLTQSDKSILALPSIVSWLKTNAALMLS